MIHRHAVADHRLRHAPVPHSPHRSCGRPEAEELLERDRMLAVRRLQRIRYGIERHIAAYAAFEAAPAHHVANGAHRDGGDRIRPTRQMGRCAVGLATGRFRAYDFSAPNTEVNPERRVASTALGAGVARR